MEKTRIGGIGIMIKPVEKNRDFNSDGDIGE